VGVFDRFAGVSAKVVGRAAFFTFCVALVVVWAPTILLIRDIDTWQLIINTVTTIITFLMVALLQNSQTRSDQAVQHKLNAIADALADFMQYRADEERTEADLKQDVVELRDAVGLEQRETTSHNDNSPARQR
jgi:low affinity Fe/Cu permease